MCFLVKENKEINEKYYYKVHKTGLPIYVFPKNHSTSFAVFGTRFGSVDSTFKTADDKDFVTVPDGVAHFLEHKLFEDENGNDAFTRYAQYGGDASHLVITGGSAGGHLASLAALSPNDPAYQPGFEDADTSVDACVPFYGVFDLANKSQHVAAKAMRDTWLAPRVFGKPFAGNEAEFEKASPLCRLDEIDPELIPDFYVLHGDNDTLVDVNQARSFVARLREVSQAMVSYTELRGAQHAFELFTSLRSHQVIASVARWLEWQRLHGSSAGTRRTKSA